MNRKLKMAIRVISMALVLFITVQIIPAHAYAAGRGTSENPIPEQQQEIIVPADYERVLDEGYKTYTMDAGRGGTVVMRNDQTRFETTVTRNDLSFSGNRLSAGVQWVYKNEQWLLSYDAIFITHTEKTSIINSEYYTLTTASKSIKFDKKGKSEDGKEAWTSQKTPGVLLTILEKGYSVEDSGSKMVFNEAGRLSSLVHSSNNDSVKITYDSDGTINKIVDAVGRQYVFTYALINGIRSLSSVTAYGSNGIAIKVDGISSTVQYGYQLYGDKNLLSTVTYPDGQIVRYIYMGDRLFIINGISKIVSCNKDDSYLYLSDGSKSMTATVEDRKMTQSPGVSGMGYCVFNYQDEKGNIDRVINRVSQGDNLLVYDKNWSPVYVTEPDNIVKNGYFYDYNQKYADGEYDVFPSIIAWEPYIPSFNYALGGGFKLKSNIKQTLEWPYDNMITSLTVTCSEISRDTYVKIKELNVEMKLEPGINIYTIRAMEGVSSITIEIQGEAVIKHVCFRKVYLGEPETPKPDITSCLCPGCETLDCPCRCESEAECECSQCVSRVTETKDKYGNLLSTARSSGSYQRKSTNTYTSNGDFLTSSTDENGVKVNYNYNQGNGLLESASNENGTSVNYSYDAMGALKSVQTQVDGQTMSNQYTYLKDRLSSISHNGFAYYFDYDMGGRLTSTKVNDTILANYNYQNDDLKEIMFANGQKVSYQYENHRITGIDMDNDGKMEYTYIYNIYNELDTAYDYVNNTKTVVRNGAAVTSTMDGKKIIYSALENKWEKKLTETVNNESLVYRTNQTQAADGAITSTIQINNDHLGVSVTDTEDSLKRLGSHEVALNGSNTSLRTGFLYKDRGSLTGTQAQLLLTLITLPDGSRKTVGSEYTYDTVGNITGENRGYSNGTEIHTAYTYDAVNQLTSEENELFSGSYYYDNAGNLYEKEVYNKETGEGKIVEYGYDAQWKDLLVEYDGQPIEHDELGNVIQDVNWDYEWESGRQLVAMHSRSDETIHTYYQYDVNGLRTYKIVEKDTGVEEYIYVWANGVLTGMEAYTPEGQYTLRFLYDNGSPIGFLVNETTPYFYVKNLMGDICEIVDKNGASVATYHYDAWGNLLKSEGDATILHLNPFTYRGYIYDSETGLYYLQSRYYNPEWNRFINADTNLDTQTSIIGTNVFAYGDNNPVMNTDNTGMSTAFDEVIPAILNALFGFALFENILESIGVNVAKFWTIADRLFGMFPQLLDFVVNKIVDLCVNGINFIGKWFENMINHFIPINDIRNGSLKFFEWGSTLYHLTGLDAIFGLQNIALDIIGSIGETALLIKLLSILVNPFVSTVLSIEMLAQVGSIGINIASLITGIFCVVKYGGYSYRIFNIGFGFLFSATIISGR